MTNEERSPPKAPVGLRQKGRQLWAAISTALDLDQRDVALLREAARVTDRLDTLDGIIRKAGPMGMDGKVHPALVEARQQQICLARLLVALRLPEDLSEPSHGRPQRRGTRGFYHPRHERSDV